MIELKHINKYYNKNKNNEIHVINDVSFVLKDQGFITLFGMSGSGKTTLLNVIGGLDKANGEIIYDQQSFKNYPSKKIDNFRKNNIGYVFQNYNLINELSVYDNLKLALEVIGIYDENEVKKRIEYCLKMVGLYKFRKKLAFALSGGQMQRVAIARALVKHSKIIIADEPTGNLDSANSIEIMEILKQISKTSLVLLVTHNQSLAEFYSDEIIEIKDGSVINHRQTSQDASLKEIYNENTIYLKDLHKFENNDGKIHYQLYTPNKDCEVVEFQLIQKNNQFILKSNCKITLLDNSSIKLIDDHYKEIKKEEYQEKFNYDTSWYNNQTHKRPFMNFFKHFVFSIKSLFFNQSKRQSFFKVALGLIGVIIAFLNILFISYSKVNEDDLSYDQQIYGITSQFDFYSNDLYKKNLKDSLKENLIDDLYQAEELYADFFIRFSTFDIQEVSIHCTLLDDQLINDYPLLAGKRSTQENEYVLSQFIADQIISQISHKNINYDSLINTTMSDKTIVGIVKYDSHAIYQHIDYKNISLPIYDNNNNYYYGINKESISYQIIEGQDINNHFEGLADINSSIQVGDVINDILIVGKVDCNDITSNLLIMDTATIKYYSYTEYTCSNVYFKSSTLNNLKEKFSIDNFYIDDMYQISKNHLLKNNRTSKSILIPIMIILSSISIIYIYFTMRSKMIKDIYEIGVRRSLGFSKFDIMLKYIIDIIVITLFTTLFGYLFTSIIYSLLIAKLSTFISSLIHIFNCFSTYAFIVAILFINVIVGSLPIYSLLRKTPSEIIAKYDI